MPSTFFGLNIGSTGLYAYKSALDLTAHNITNSGRDGYSRQVLNTQASRALKVNSSYGMVGTGINILSIDRIRNEYFDVKFRSNATILGEYSTKSDYMNQIQSYMNEVKLEGFMKTFNSMFDSLQDISRDPSNITTRTQTTNFGTNFTEYFNFISKSMNSIQEQSNFEVKNQVDRVNSLAVQIAHLNKQINTIESNGLKANDLRDERDLLLDELSKIANITVTENIVGDGIGINSFTVKINGQTLVDTVDFNELVLVPRKEKINQNDIDGLYDIAWSHTGQMFEPVTSLNSGTLKALFQVRDGNDRGNLQGKATAMVGSDIITMTETNIDSADHLNIPPQGTITVGNTEYKYTGFTATKVGDKLVYEFKLSPEPENKVIANVTDKPAEVGKSINYKGIPYYMAQMNQFVRTFAREFNDIHKQGEDLYGNKAKDFFNALDKVSGKDHGSTDINGNETSFGDKDAVIKAGSYYVDEAGKSYYFMTAANFKVSDTIVENPRLLATTKRIIDGVEANDLIDQLIRLKADKDMFKQGQPASFLQTLIAEVGIDTRKVNNFSKSQENVLLSIENQRLSVSGVDQDEETINLIRYQNAYNLSAKVVSVMDEIYDKLINYMGV